MAWRVPKMQSTCACRRETHHSCGKTGWVNDPPPNKKSITITSQENEIEEKPRNTQRNARMTCVFEKVAPDRSANNCYTRQPTGCVAIFSNPIVGSRLEFRSQNSLHLHRKISVEIWFESFSNSSNYFIVHESKLELWKMFVCHQLIFL